MFFFCFFCFFQATILQLPRILVKDDVQAAEAAGGAAEAAGARPAKPVAARLELEGEKRLPEGASWRFGEPGDEACRMRGTGWYRQVTITEKEGGGERKTNLTLPSYVWVGGETAKWPQAAEGETVAAFLCLFGMNEPPQRKSYFLLRVCSLWEGGYTGRDVWQKLHRGGDIHQVGGYDPPPSVVDATADWVRQYAPKGGRPGKSQTNRGPDVVVVELDAPPPLRGKGQTPAPKPSPKPSKVAKVAKAEKAQGNTQRALDQAPNLAAKRGGEVEAMREALREAQEGRRKAEVEAAQLRVEVEGRRRRGDDLGQRLGVAEAQVRSLTSTLCASFGAQQAQQGLAPQGLQSQGIGSRSGSQ